MLLMCGSSKGISLYLYYIITDFFQNPVVFYSSLPKTPEGGKSI